MKIAVNTRLLQKNKLEGIGWFTFEVLKRLTLQHPEHDFLFLFDRPFDASFIFSKNVTPIIIGPQARHPLLFYWWFEWSVPKVLQKHKVDLFLSPDGYLSLCSSVQSVAVIHDLNFEHYPKQLPFLIWKYYQYFFPKFAHHATKIATVSQFSKNDIVTKYNIDPNKIGVVYNGVNSIFKPIEEDEKIVFRKKYSNKLPYFVYVGSINPRKNLGNLFLAFDAFLKTTDTQMNLLVIGEKMWSDVFLTKILNSLRYKKNIVFTGRLPTNELAKIMAGATALTYVSLFEGFGIPLLEAMQCEIPIITSNVTSLPEIAGAAALLVNPDSTESIMDAMLQITQKPSLALQLIEKGKEQRKKFNWDKTADKLWAIIDSLNKPKYI